MNVDSNKNEFLDIVGLLSIFINQKFLILGIVLLAAFGTAIYSLVVEEEWISYSTVVPGNSRDIESPIGGLSGLASSLGVVSDTSEVSDINKNIAVLESRYFINKFIEKNEYTQILFNERWDSENNLWIGTKPTESEVYDIFFGELLSVNKNRKTGVITIAITYKNPRVAKDIVNLLINDVNSHIREDSIAQAKRNIDYINLTLAEATQKTTVNSLTSLMRSELNKLMVAETLDELAFKVIDPGFIPERRAYPSRTRMVLLAAFVSLFVALFIAFFREKYPQIKIIEAT